MLQYTKRNIADQYDLRIQYCLRGCLKHVLTVKSVFYFIETPQFYTFIIILL